MITQQLENKILFEVEANEHGVLKGKLIKFSTNYKYAFQSELEAKLKLKLKENVNSNLKDFVLILTQTEQQYYKGNLNDISNSPDCRSEGGWDFHRAIERLQEEFSSINIGRKSIKKIQNGFIRKSLFDASEELNKVTETTIKTTTRRTTRKEKISMTFGVQWIYKFDGEIYEPVDCCENFELNEFRRRFKNRILFSNFKKNSAYIRIICKNLDINYKQLKKRLKKSLSDRNCEVAVEILDQDFGIVAKLISHVVQYIDSSVELKFRGDHNFIEATKSFKDTCKRLRESTPTEN